MNHLVLLAVLAGLTASAVALAGCGSDRAASADPPPVTSPEAAGPTTSVTPDRTPAPPQTAVPPVASPTPASQRAAAPEPTAIPTREPTAASPSPTPKPEPEALATEQSAVISLAPGARGTVEDDSASEDWKVANADPPQSDPKGTEESPSSPRGSVGGEARTEGEVYTWQDGDRIRRVLLQTDLAVGSDDQVVRGGGGEPVFVSESSGELMTLPGGVLLVFEPSWSHDQIDAFFSEQGIKQHLVTEQTFTTNAYFIETDPGFPSLELANELAGQDGVLLASPNWQREVSTR